MMTIGHGTAPAERFVELLDAAGVRRVVDVRSFPGSRRNPQFGRDEMARWLPAAGIAYLWSPGLGGRRRPTPGSVHVALRNAAFRAYADHMGTPPFRDGVEELLALDEVEATTVMCSESVWWRCHRRLLADHLVLVRDIPVEHLMHDGRRTAHAVTPGARAGDQGVVYDVVAPEP